MSVPNRQKGFHSTPEPASRYVDTYYLSLRRLTDQWLIRFSQSLRERLEREAGYTLVELLVVLAIISMIVGLVGPRALNYLSDSKVKTARVQIESLSSAIDLYYLDTGSYPTSAIGLSALVRKPDGMENWNGPYLKGTAVPNDPWGRPYSYVFPGQHGNPYDIMSFGSDGQEGGSQHAADITSWQK